MLEYFHHMNIIGLIPYSVVLCIIFIFIVKFYPLLMVFSVRFSHKILVFLFIFIFYHYAIDFNKNNLFSKT